MKITKKSYGLLKSFSKSILAMSVAATSTALVLSTAVQASDIDIYQQAKSGDITLMFMLDISTSMVGSGSYDGTGTERLTRVKKAMLDLLQGNASVVPKIEKLSDDKVIGLSTLGSPSQMSGAILVPARRLDATYNGKTQRAILIEQITNLKANSVTPTARSYAEAIAYLMGETSIRPGYTKDNDLHSYYRLKLGGFSYAPPEAISGTKYISPTSLTQTDDIKKCSGQGIYVLTDGDPNYANPTEGFAKVALGSNGANFSCNDKQPSSGDNATGWDCTRKLGQAILDPLKNPKGLKFKTAVVGFGNSFNSVAPYDRKLTKEENIAKINSSSASDNQKQAALWGVESEGGWYSGNSSKDIVDSVNAFLGDLATDIPSVTTGSPTVPKDPLNSSLYQTDAYFPQFQPTPDKTYQLWAGNLKKYKLNGAGQLVDKASTKILDTDGKIIDNFDYWSKAIDIAVVNDDINTSGSRLFALKGGTWSQLNLRVANNIENRKILTNRIASGSLFVGGTTLRQIKVADLTDSVYKNDPNRGYLMSLLGYSVDATNPTTINLNTAPELRQIGAVMHSSPILITNKGSVKYDETQKKMVSSSRDDYVLYGTTQGLVHVVEATTGKEKFSFLPNEMVENQKEAFLKSDATTGGLNKLFYGVDAPWTLYSEYVLASSGGLTVGKGKGNQEGKQLVYGGLRMGGRSYYALNLQDMNNPKLQFHISPADKKVYYNGSSKSYDELKFMAQSWSKPTIAWVKWGNYRKRVMFVGGGYDAGGDDGDARTAGVKGAYAGYESDNYNQTNQKGAGVYMFDADNGDLLWWASANASTTAATATSGVIALQDTNLKYSVVSEIRPVDSDADGLSDHIYFGDLGGQVFRIDLNNKAQTLGAFSYKSTRLLNLNNGAKSPRFYEMPAFSVYDSGGERFAVISLGSGNRSKPLVDYDTAAGYQYDAIYNVYDKDVAKDIYKSGYSYLTHDIVSAGLTEISQSNRTNNSTIVAPYLTSNGWYYRFQAMPKQQSIKVISTPIVSNHKLFVSTFDGTKPGLAGDCGAGVKGESYMNLFCMPFGQCAPTSGSGSDGKCLEAQGCKIGPGLQDPKPVIIADPPICTGPDCGGGGGSGSGPKPNSNLCISTGNLGIPLANGPVLVGQGKKCLIPTRWYEQFR